MRARLETFCERVKMLRKERGLTQTEMGVVLGCSMRNYHRLEHGEINVPATVLMDLSNYFGVTTDYLLGQTDER